MNFPCSLNFSSAFLILLVCDQPAGIKSDLKRIPLISGFSAALLMALKISGSPKTSSSKSKIISNSSNEGLRSVIGKLRFRSKTLFDLIDLTLEGETIILAVAEISMRIIVKKSPRAVNVPKIEARKFLKKFIFNFL